MHHHSNRQEHPRRLQQPQVQAQASQIQYRRQTCRRACTRRLTPSRAESKRPVESRTFSSLKSRQRQRWPLTIRSQWTRRKRVRRQSTKRRTSSARDVYSTSTPLHHRFNSSSFHYLRTTLSRYFSLFILLLLLLMIPF